MRPAALCDAAAQLHGGGLMHRHLTELLRPECQELLQPPATPELPVPAGFDQLVCFG